MALPQSTTHISDMTTTTEVTPEDYVPIVRFDEEEQNYDNYKTKARYFISYPFGYLYGGVMTASSSSVTISPTYCRDSTGFANIMIENAETKLINANLFYPHTVPSSAGMYYILAARVSEADTTSTFFLSQQNGGALGSSYAYSRAVGECYVSAGATSITKIRGFDHRIVTVTETDIQPGSPLESGQIALVIEPL